MKKMIEADAGQVKAWVDAGEAVIIDVREAPELIQARVPGAVHIPMLAFDPTPLDQQDGKKLIFMCAMGMRSMQVGTYLIQNDMIEEGYNLAGGIKAWAMAGGEIEAG
ncbi:MAG: rhodanese-like domain-containing protein [Rhodospirillaceae bacterium]